jgi:hypothetical protein
VTSECPYGTACDSRQLACMPERCTDDGRCPEGWEKVVGSLECRITSCESIG